MTEAELATLILKVLGAAFALGFAFGFIAQRTHFCTMGAIADLVSMGDTTRLRMWALAAGTAALGFAALAATGRISAADTAYAAPELPWLSFTVGGLMFGCGMVLASGCGSKSLIRVGSGNLKSLVVVLVMGLSGWATLKGVFALLRHHTVDRVVLTLPGGQDLPTVLGHGFALTPGPGLIWACGLGFAGLLLAWSFSHRELRRGLPLAGGLGIGLCVVALWWVSGVMGQVAEHPVTLERVFVATASRRMESFTFVAPTAQLLEYLAYASDANRQLSLGVAATLGVLAGSCAQSLSDRSFRWEGFTRVDDLARHLIGAVLMGVGGVTAMGCTIGQGLSGLSTLSIGSLLATASILLGGWLTLRWQVWRLERSA